MRCGKRDIRLWISVNFTGVKNSKSIPTKSLIDRCENVINFEVVSKNTIKRDCSFNVYRQRKISFEDRVVVEGSKTSSINQYGAGPKHPKTGRVDNFRNRRNKNRRKAIFNWAAKGLFFLKEGGGYTHSGYRKTLSATIACDRTSCETET